MPHVVFVDPIPESQRPFLRGLKRVGATITGIGAIRPDQLDTELRYLLAGYELVPDLADEAAVVAAVRRIQARGPWVDRLETLLEAHLLVTARAREATEIPGEPADRIELTRDKVRLKAFLRDHGVHSAPDTPAHTLSDAEAFADRVGYPVILKPRGGSGLADLFRIDDREALARAWSQARVDERPDAFTVEKFAGGHEGFHDALVCNGEIVFEGAIHFYPPVLEALRNRDVTPIAVCTNRLAHDGYDELRALNRTVIRALGVGTSPTHLEWFHGEAGRWFSEFGLHPPPTALWDLYAEAADIDLYTEWARAIATGAVQSTGAARWSAGLVNLRPPVDGTITGYVGIEAMQRNYGAWIFRMHLPPPGARTQPIASGYLANAYVCLKHPDYDVLRSMLADVAASVRVLASAEPAA